MKIEWKNVNANIQLPKVVVGEFPGGIYCVELTLNPFLFNFQHLNVWIKGIIEKQDLSSQDKLYVLRDMREFYQNKDKKTFALRSEKGSLYIFKVKSLEFSNKANISIVYFKSNNGFTSGDIESLVDLYQKSFSPYPTVDSSVENHTLAFSPGPNDVTSVNLHELANLERVRKPNRKDQDLSRDPSLEEFKALGVEVFDPSNSENFSWDSLAGYHSIKQQLKSTVLNALQFPELYDSIASRTRERFESNRPKAVLLEGPPGTGKTLTARILASQCNRPLVVLNLENIVSKWYGDSEKKLASIFDSCDSLESGAVIFVDEIDALARSRDSDMHEASRRLLSVLLQRIEGFHGKTKSLIVCATNRKQDLDAAVLSRFDLILTYDLPDKDTRVEIFKRYAKQFSSSVSYERLADAADGLSCREIKEACEQAEREFASRIIDAQIAKLSKDGKSNIGDEFLKIVGDKTPAIDEYIATLTLRRAMK